MQLLKQELVTVIFLNKEIKFARKTSFPKQSNLFLSRLKDCVSCFSTGFSFSFLFSITEQLNILILLKPVSCMTSLWSPGFHRFVSLTLLEKHTLIPAKTCKRQKGKWTTFTTVEKGILLVLAVEQQVVVLAAVVTPALGCLVQDAHTRTRLLSRWSGLRKRQKMAWMVCKSCYTGFFLGY